MVWWSDIKGYGFIRPDEGSVDYFAARLALKMPTVPSSGQRVVFEIIRGPCGPQAGNVGPPTP